MHILRLSYRVPPMPGGLERHVERLTHEQVRRGHRVTMAFRHGTALPPGAARLPLRTTAMSRALARMSDKAAFAVEAAAMTRQLCGGSRAHDIDMLHLHGDHTEAMWLGPVCRHLGIPLCLTVHGRLATRWQRLARHAFRQVDAFIALGSGTAADLVARGVPERRILTMSSGLELSRMPSATAPRDRESGLIVSVGALDPVKNHALLIEAFHDLARDRPELRLVIAGEGPELDRLRTLAAAGPGVELVGALPRQEVYRLVGRAEVFVLASRRLPGKGEGVPTAALEALAMGTPVVVSSEATLHPVIRDPEAYRIFRSGSKTDLTGALTTLLDDAALRERMSALGRRAAAELDWPVVAGRVEEWYRTALGSALTRL
ncbi:glycosyltransferase family 4 protein [Streptomyces cavernae]|uniref:glycosyltransferase family 4 protein n=1 Tax=Streptomyces cavernae TaxID=2259034 RepID=UPI000FEBB294|nr:glycosyltransferase family 4 protein [Streptomyces cavernae]